MEHDDGGAARRRGRLLAGAVGLAALVALTAGAVITFGPSSSGHAQSAPTPSGAPATTAPADPAPTGTAAAPEQATAAPAGHVTGHVKDGVHTGDLRYFLLAPPKDADVYGDPDGSPYTADDITSGASNQADARAALKTYGFRSGVYRTYLSADGVYEVTAKLLRFRAPGQAAAYYGGHYFTGTTIALDGGYPARAYRLTSASAESTDAVAAVSYQGDVQFTLTVTGSKTLSRAMLQSLLDAQHQRLTPGH